MKEKIYHKDIYRDIDKIITTLNNLSKKITDTYRNAEFDSEHPKNFVAYGYNSERIIKIFYLLKEIKEETGIH